MPRYRTLVLFAAFASALCRPATGEASVGQEPPIVPPASDVAAWYDREQRPELGPFFEEGMRFAVFSNCEPVGVRFIGGRQFREPLRSLVERRLRGARLYAEWGRGGIRSLDPHLIVKLHTPPATGGLGTFVLSVDYAKPVIDVASGHTRLAVTALGIEVVGFFNHGDVAPIAVSLSEEIDEFLAAYVAVNESACR